MKVIDANTFVNSFKIKPDKSMSFLLGAGASVSSNIPSGGQFDGRGGYPELWSPEEYSFYFERCGLNIPNGNNTKRFRGYPLSGALKASTEEFFNGICRYIDAMEKEKHEFDVLVIYIPNQLSKMRELKSETVYFDLHDSLKIYCAGKGIVTQIIEERSVHTNSDIAKIMWGLSTAIYTKAVGKLWKPKMTRYDTAYIGLSYVQSIKNNEKISIGCSQLFDSEGNGMDPQIIQKNPYMRSGDACRLMNNLKKFMTNRFLCIN